MSSTSVSRGTRLSTNRPGVRTAAAITLSTEFFAPEIRTVPSRDGPGSTTTLVTTPNYACRSLRLVTELARAVDRHHLVELTRALVAIDTQNPPGNESAAIPVAARALAQWASATDVIEPEPGRGSVVITVPASRANDARSAPTLIVNGHLDVVPVVRESWTREPFGGELDGDRLYGRGTADMKGGIAAAIEAVALLRRLGVPQTCNVVFHLVAAEELGGGKGCAQLDAAGLLVGDACIDPEPTSMRISVAERGVLTATLTTHGTPGHGSQPHAARSAVADMAKIVTALHGADFGDAEHPWLGRPSANAGAVSGGTSANVVAQTCSLLLDRRVLPGTTEADAIASVRSKVEPLGVHDWQLAVDFFGSASEIAQDHPWVDTVRNSFVAALGREPELVGMHFTTDARYVRARGIPAVVVGPGDIEQAHRVDESVSVAALVDAAVLYAQLFSTLDTPVPPL